MTLQEAAKSFMYPIEFNHNNKNSYTNKYYEEKYGKQVWKEACVKARTEYNFGSSAVKW